MPQADRTSGTLYSPPRSKAPPQEEIDEYEKLFRAIQFLVFMFWVFDMCFLNICLAAPLKQGNSQAHSQFWILKAMLQSYGSAASAYLLFGFPLAGVAGLPLVGVPIFTSVLFFIHMAQLGCVVLMAANQNLPCKIDLLDAVSPVKMLLRGTLVPLLYFAVAGIPFGGVIGFTCRHLHHAAPPALHKLKTYWSIVEEWCFQVLLARRAEAQ